MWSWLRAMMVAEESTDNATASQQPQQPDKNATGIANPTPSIASQLSSFGSGTEKTPQASSPSFIAAALNASSAKPLPPSITIQRCTTEAYVAGLRRLNTVLLPIPYPDFFYREITQDPDTVELTRIGVLRDKKRKRKEDDAALDGKNHTDKPAGEEDEALGRVIGGIRCRYEQLPVSPYTYFSNPSSATAKAKTSMNSITSNSTGLMDQAKLQAGKKERRIYIQTLAIQAPYRSLGIGTRLLEEIIQGARAQQPKESKDKLDSSSQQKNLDGSNPSPGNGGTAQGGVTTEIYAHVWEKNEEALDWYRRRGFEIGETIEGYYRRLRPSGAVVVRKALV